MNEEQLTQPQQYVFFLGGKDAEMERIASVLQAQNIPYHNSSLGWVAKASSYKDEIQSAIKQGQTPVWVELQPDIPYEGSVAIDHHGPRAHEPASLLQVLKLIGVTPSRMDLLIAANDAGYIPAMQKMEATQGEIDTVRRMDRAAQGVTAEHEAEAEKALRNVEHIGEMIVVRVPP